VYSVVLQKVHYAILITILCRNIIALSHMPLAVALLLRFMRDIYLCI
jgi:hypothetical protein